MIFIGYEVFLNYFPVVDFTAIRASPTSSSYRLMRRCKALPDILTFKLFDEMDALRAEVHSLNLEMEKMSVNHDKIEHVRDQNEAHHKKVTAELLKDMTIYFSW